MEGLEQSRYPATTLRPRAQFILSDVAGRVEGGGPPPQRAGEDHNARATRAAFANSVGSPASFNRSKDHHSPSPNGSVIRLSLGGGIF